MVEIRIRFRVQSRKGSRHGRQMQTVRNRSCGRYTRLVPNLEQHVVQLGVPRWVDLIS